MSLILAALASLMMVVSNAGIRIIEKIEDKNADGERELNYNVVVNITLMRQEWPDVPQEGAEMLQFVQEHLKSQFIMWVEDPEPEAGVGFSSIKIQWGEDGIAERVTVNCADPANGEIVCGVTLAIPEAWNFDKVSFLHTYGDMCAVPADKLFNQRLDILDGRVKITQMARSVYPRSFGVSADFL